MSNAYLIRQSFLVYRYESGIVISAWRVIFNYAYSSLTHLLFQSTFLNSRNFECLEICRVGEGKKLHQVEYLQV